MKIEIVKKDNAAVVRMDGDLDFNTCTGFNDKISEILDGSPSKLILDMANVSHVDSMGLGSITKIWKSTDKMQCEFGLAAVQKNVNKLISLINLDNRIKIYDDVDSAL